MAVFPNPVLLEEGQTPADGEVPFFHAATNTWRSGTAVSGVTIPQAHIADPTETAGGVATTAPVDGGTGGSSPAHLWAFTTSAQATAVLTQINDLQADVATLVTQLTTLYDELEAAGILASS